MAITNLPVITSAVIVETLKKLLVFKPALTNANYAGEVKYAGSVKILSATGVAVESYTPGTPLSTAVSLTDSVAATLTIDQAKAYQFLLEDMNLAQTPIQLLNIGATEAAYKMADAIDSYIASFATSITEDSDLTGTVGLGNTDTKPSVWLATMVRKFAEANVPTSGLRVVVPPWFAQAYQQEVINRNTAAGDAALTSGYLGTSVHGVGVYVSNNVYHSTTDWVICGQPKITFASAATTESETVRSIEQFGDIVRGLFVYGAAVAGSTQMKVGKLTKGDLS